MSVDAVIMHPENDDESVEVLVGQGGMIPIPLEFLRRHRLEAGSHVLIHEEADAIVIRPADSPARIVQPKRLDALLEAITPENLHGEWQTGPAVGREEW
jgi:antitoxin MazE